jgi:hypothetical protein
MLRRKPVIHIHTHRSKLSREVPAVELFVFQSSQDKSSTMIEHDQGTPARRRLFGAVDSHGDLVTVARRSSHILFYDARRFAALNVGHDLFALREHSAHRWDVIQ